MCGIVGYSGEGNASPDKLRLLMFWNAVERGKDSTGLYTPKMGVIKDKFDARYFMDELGDVDDNLFIGHVRSATVGNVTAKTAHPFEIGNVIMVHNGTLIDYFNLAWSIELKNNQWDVDSEILAYGLDKFQDPKILTMFEGAAAIVWVDKRKPGKLMVFRNKERPLFRGKLGNGMYISSIEDSLLAIGCTNVQEFKENNVYYINNGKIEYMTKVPIKERIIVPVQPKNKHINSSNLTHIELSYLDPEEFEGTWVRPKPFHLYAKGVNNGEWLLCLGGSETKLNNNMLLLMDKFNNKHVVNKYDCDWTEYIINERDFVKINCKGAITYTGTAKVFCKNGEILQVTEVGSEAYSLKNLFTGEQADVRRKFFHKADELQVRAFLQEVFAKRKEDRLKNVSSEDTKIKVLQKSVKFTKNMKEFVNSVLSSIQDKAEVVDEKIKDGKDTKDAIKDLMDTIDKYKFSIEEILEKD